MLRPSFQRGCRDGRRLPGRLVDAEHEHHAADEMDEQIAWHPVPYSFQQRQRAKMFG